MKPAFVVTAICLFIPLVRSFGVAFVLPPHATDSTFADVGIGLRVALDVNAMPALLPRYDPATQAVVDSSVVTASQQARINKIIPRRATIRSLLVPGLGQIYNQQYWKLPIIYGGLGAAILIYDWNQGLYTQYLAGYREAYNSPEINPNYGAKTAIVRGEELTVQSLKRATDQYQRQRTLTIICTVAGWALNVVEANVAAHLKTFDISDDISMRVQPNAVLMPGLGLAPGFSVALRFR